MPAASSTAGEVVRRRRTGSLPQIELRLASGAVLLLTLGVGWLLLMAEVSGGDARAMCGVALAVMLTFVAARRMTAYRGWLAPLLVAMGAAFLAVSQADTLLGRPLGNPFGYSNAVGSFYMVAAAAALLVAVRVPQREFRALAAAGAVAAALVPWLNATATASVLVCLLPLALFARTPRSVRFAVGAAALALLGTLSVSILVGATYEAGQRSGSLDRLVDATLTERRAELWRDALVMVAAHPLTGVGPNRFPEESPTARKDRDTRWPHNESLHFAAEAGVPGLLFLLGLFGWGFARLWWGAGDRGAAVAALALGAVGVHSNVDYVLHFPAVGMAVAALVGAGSRLPARTAREVRRRGSGKRSESSGQPPEWDLSFLDRPRSAPLRRGSTTTQSTEYRR